MQLILNCVNTNEFLGMFHFSFTMICQTGFLNMIKLGISVLVFEPMDRTSERRSIGLHLKDDS